MKILLQKRLQLFFFFKMQIHFQYSATMTESTWPWIPQIAAYDELHLEMMQVRKKKRTKSGGGELHKTATGIEQQKVKSNQN